MQNKQNSTLTKNQNTKSMPDLHGKDITKKNNSRSSSVVRGYTDSSISQADTRASINGDDSDVESIDGNGKKKLTGFAERINSNTKNLSVMGDARTKYSGVATAILGMIDANNDDYSKENKDDFFTAVRSQMQKSLGSNATLKDEIWRSEFDRVFQNSSKGRNFLGILERNAVDTKALEEKNLSLQEQIAKDKEAQDELKLEVEKATQKLKTASDVNNTLTNKTSDLESKLTQETQERERLAEEQKKKDEELAKLKQERLTKESEIEKLQMQMQDSGSQTATEKSELQRQIDKLTQEKEDLATEGQSLKTNLNEAERDKQSLEGKVQDVEGRLSKEESARQKLEQEKEDALNKKGEFEKLNKELEEKLRGLEEKMTDLNSKIQGFEDDINTKNKEIIELENRLKNGQQLSDEEKERLNQQIAELNNEKQNLEAKRRETQEEKKILEEENQKKANEKDALQQAIEKLNLQNQQSEQEKRSQADILNAEKLKNDKLPAEVETNKELAGGKEKGQNQPDQQSQQNDITFEPDSAKDKISGRAKEIGKSVADNLFIIAAMIGTIMALMSGAGFAVIIVAAVTPMAGMMVNKGINMIADQIERSQKKKEKAENLERERSPNLSQKLNPDLQNMGQVSTNPEKNGDEELDKQSEGDEESLENESTRGSQNDEYQETELDDAVDGKKSDIGDDIEDSDRTSVKEGDFEDADIQKINDEIGEGDKVIVDFEAKNLNRAAEGRLNLDGTTGKFTTTGEVEFKNPSTIDGLDLDGAVNPQIYNSSIAYSQEEKAQLKKEMVHSPTLKTSEQINASEISYRAIKVDHIAIKEDENVVHAPEFTEAEQKDKQIAKLLEKRKNIQQEHNQYKAAEKILNQKSYDLEQTIKDRKAKTVSLSKDIMNLQSKMNDAGMSDESEKKTGLFDSETKRQKQFKDEIALIEAKINLAKKKSNNPNTQDDGEKNRGYYEKKIKDHEEERSNLVQKNKEKDNLKKEMEAFKKQLAAISKNEKALQDKKGKLEPEMVKLEGEILKKDNEEKKVQQQIDNRKNAIKLENEKTAKALEAKKLQEERKEAAKLQAIQKKKQEKYEKEVANLKKAKVELKKKVEENKKAGIMSTADKKAAERELESKALDEDHAAIRSQERKAQEDTLKQKLQERAKSKLDKSNQISGSKVVDNSQHELLEGLINADEIDLSGASDKHSAKSFVVDANQSPSSGTASQIQ